MPTKRIPAGAIATAVVAAALAMLPTAIQAHHSTAQFDANKIVNITGTLSDVNWTNPHTYVSVKVADKGKVTEWSIISGTPSMNVRNGWKRSDLKLGDKVTAVVHPDRMGRPQGILRSLKLGDGRTLAGPREFLVVPRS